MIGYGAYRSPPVTSRQCIETVERLRSAFGRGNEPLLDSILSDALLFNESVPHFMRRIAGMVTSWYTPYLVREIKDAMDYEEAIPAAALLAFSEKARCINALGGLLRSNRPLEILVSSEALGDLAAYSDSLPARRLAVFHLSACGREIAQLELENAKMLSASRGIALPEQPAWESSLLLACRIHHPG